VACVTPPDNAAIDPAAAPAADAPTSAPPAKKSMLRWAIEASGPIGIFLVGLSIYFTALVIRLFLEFRVSEAVPPALIEKLESLDLSQIQPPSLDVGDAQIRKVMLHWPALR